ncbi:DNA-binding transcriptional regulator [Hydrogenophaga crassostreae]|uniref:DNA-binding transcriptional regulator n=1 Tax=Hydrogenophaga crassostreae TaxID=1763535 RepID=A0A167GQH0_9BURK|nr:YafY family protein [Hydrogenophaga crassostreae]AOW11667.1 DNA-binding transcriptional regulator [Hydrogenophaga crassostreae]OAD39760.1 DNA-binding transcriptional regulator [Hydrogenophaga crassostreae]
MRRADRLFSIVQLIRGRRLSTAAWLAERLEVSPRTVYRDVADLQHQGVPIEGEAGVGYRLGRGFDLPPLMFTLDEARALAMATQMASQWLDPALALAASDAMSRVMSVLPASMRAEIEHMPIVAPGSGLEPAVARQLQTLREATQKREVLQIDYEDLRNQHTTRAVWPLGCFYWGTVWTLAAWCENRSDFRSFRVDRIRSIAPADRRFGARAGRTLADMLRQVSAREGGKRHTKAEPPIS